MINSFLTQSASTQRRLKLWGLAAALYVFYLLGHIPVSNICYALRDRYTEPVYRQTLEIIGWLLLGVFVLWLGWRLWLTQYKAVKALAWLVFGGLLANYYAQIVKITIEYVHFIQYCGLTLVVAAALNNRIWVALIICLGAGFLDEVYQAANSPDLLNWRDIGLNITGCVWGLLIWWTVKVDNNVEAEWRRVDTRN